MVAQLAADEHVGRTGLWSETVPVNSRILLTIKLRISIQRGHHSLLFRLILVNFFCWKLHYLAAILWIWLWGNVRNRWFVNRLWRCDSMLNSHVLSRAVVIDWTTFRVSKGFNISLAHRRRYQSHLLQILDEFEIADPLSRMHRLAIKARFKIQSAVGLRITSFTALNRIRDLVLKRWMSAQSFTWNAWRIFSRALPLQLILLSLYFLGPLQVWGNVFLLTLICGLLSSNINSRLSILNSWLNLLNCAETIDFVDRLQRLLLSLRDQRGLNHLLRILAITQSTLSYI